VGLWLKTQSERVWPEAAQLSLLHGATGFQHSCCCRGRSCTPTDLSSAYLINHEVSTRRILPRNRYSKLNMTMHTLIPFSGRKPTAQDVHPRSSFTVRKDPRLDWTTAHLRR